MAWPSIAAERRGSIRHDSVQFGRERKAAQFPYHLVPAVAAHPARAGMGLEERLHARLRGRQAVGAIEVDLGALVAQAQHVTMRIDQAWQERRTAAVDVFRVGKFLAQKPRRRRSRPPCRRPIPGR